MNSKLMSSEEMLRWSCFVCGIKGAMKVRRGIKHGTVQARRRNDKKKIVESLDET